MKIERLTAESRKNLLEDLLKRSPNQYGQYEERVQVILNRVKEEKDQALFAYTEQFDHAKITAETIKVTEGEIQEAYEQVDEDLLRVVRKALKNIESYHAKQMQYSWFDSKPNGTMLGQKVTALQRVGVYVLGGKAVYPLSLIHITEPTRP